MAFWVNGKKPPQKLGNLKAGENIIFEELTKDFTIISQGEGKIRRGIYDKAKNSYVIKDIDDNATLLSQINTVKSKKLLYTKRNKNYDYEFWCEDLENKGAFLPYDEDTLYYSDFVGDSKNLKFNLYLYKFGKGSKLVASEVSRVSLAN